LTALTAADGDGRVLVTRAGSASSLFDSVKNAKLCMGMSALSFCHRWMAKREASAMLGMNTMITRL
jgi:hypothetical protein